MLDKTQSLQFFKSSNVNLRNILIVILLGFVAYLPVLRAQFTNWDDRLHILENPLVNSLSPENLVATFTTTVNKTYIPLSTLSFAIEHALFGFNPFVFHLDNLLLHLATVTAIYFLVLSMRLSELSALISALIFCLHPIHVESVAWATERKDVLYAFFYVLSLIFYVRYVGSGNKRLYLISLGCAVLSMLSKPMALSLPFALVLIDGIVRKKWEKKFFIEKIPYIAIIIPLAWITYSLHVRIPGQGVWESGLIWFWSLTFYIKKFFFPVELVPLYKLPTPIVLSHFEYFFSIAIFIAMIGFCIKFKNDRWFIFALLYYFISIFFLLRFDDVDNTIVADRFMYLPSLGFCFWIGCRWAGWIENRRGMLQKISIVLLAVLLMTLGIKTFFQAKVWQDSITLWNYVIAKTPQANIAYNNRGEAYFQAENYDQAMKDFQQAARIEPRDYRAFNNIGNSYSHLGNKAQAESYYKHALFLKPGYVDALKNLANIHIKQKDYLMGVEYLTQLLTNNPKDVIALNIRGVAYNELGQPDKAIEDFNHAIEISPSYVDGYFNRGLTYFKLKQFDLALKDFDQVTKIKPDMPQSYYFRLLINKMLRDDAGVVINSRALEKLGYKIKLKEINE